MKRASYRNAVALIALNDGPGEPWARDVEQVAGMMSVTLVADLFGVTEERVARDVVACREREDIS